MMNVDHYSEFEYLRSSVLLLATVKSSLLLLLLLLDYCKLM